MTRQAGWLVLLLISPALCADDNGKNGKEEKPAKLPKTLFEWLPGEKDDEENGGDEEDEPLASDRPDFTEASSTVGLGRIQLEAGYTFFHDRENGVKTEAHSYPEALLRVGLFAEWFELRIGQNYANVRSRGPGDTTLVAPGVTPVEVGEGANGFEDLYLGFKLYVVEQKAHFLPEIALVVQTTVPTGARTLTADEMLPGVNLLYGWDVIEDHITLGASTQVNRAIDGEGHYYTELAQSVTMGLRFTKKLGMYTEYFGLYPNGAIDADTTPVHFANAGFTYLVTNDFQLDIRAGVGLNRHAEDFFTGAGFAIRY